MSNQTSKPKKFITNLSELLFGANSSDKKEEAPSIDQSQNAFSEATQKLDSAVETLKSTVERRKKELLSQKQDSQESHVVNSHDDTTSSLELQQKELEDSIHAMKKEIFRLHSVLKTNINEGTLHELLEDFSDLTSMATGKELDARMRTAIVAYCYEELGSVSWKILLEHMEKQQTIWPEPNISALAETEEEHQQASKYRMLEAEQVFLHQDLKTGLECMMGQVSAWKKYPSSSSWLWQDVALRGVASGIRCTLMKVVVDKLIEESDSLKTKAHELIEESMSQIQNILTTGVRSLQEAEQVVKGTELIVNEIVPSLAWDMAKQTLDRAIINFSSK